MRHRVLLLNSAVAFALALMAMITLHELAHGVAALMQGQQPVIHPSSEDDNAATVGAKVFIALAGPLWSLVSGVVVLALPQVPASRAFWRLAVLWFGLLSVQEFSGYLFVGLFTNVGDIGSTYKLLGSPIWLKRVVFAVGAALTYLTARVATRRLLEVTNTSGDTAAQMRALGLFAWLIGVAIVVIVSLPNSERSSHSAIVIFELLGTLTSGIFLVYVRWLSKVIHVPPLSPAFRWPIGGILVMLALAVGRHLLFVPGLTL
ncbi:MAG: hypothetical protein ACR2MY_03665 [Candidatus Dormibacteria bacterium]